MNLYLVELATSDGKYDHVKKFVTASDMMAACSKALVWAKKTHASHEMQVFRASFEGYVLT